MTENMWGKIEELEAVILPLVYLREQAEILSEMTGRVVLGKILTGEAKTKESSKGNFVCYLETVIPSLNNYSTVIVRVEYPITIYPLKMIDMIGSKNYTCSSEEEFIGDLKTILSSEKVRNALSVLYAQGKEREKGK